MFCSLTCAPSIIYCATWGQTTTTLNNGFDQVFLLALVMYKAVLGLHYQRQQQKKDGQLAIF
jgi:uncharacterized membrane protein YdjX (TVP38/TMEM64 family)